MADYRSHKKGQGWRVSIDFQFLRKNSMYRYKEGLISEETIRMLITEAFENSSLVKKYIDPVSLQVREFEEKDDIDLGYSYP